MQKWEKALDKFMQRYINKPWFLGAVLCGSYSTGNQNKFSDIDVTIVASNDIGWNEKSNCYVDGFLFEYIINPIYKYQTFMENDIKNHKTLIHNMFAYGKILYDKNGTVKQLHKSAIRDLNKKPVPFSKYSNDFRKYHLWDKYDELLSSESRGLHIDLQYWLLVNALISGYYDFKNMSCPPPSKLEMILTNPKYTKQYHVKDMPSKAFTEKLMACMNAKSKSAKMDAIKDFYNYVMRAGGGFDIGQFRGKRKIEKR